MNTHSMPNPDAAGIAALSRREFLTLLASGIIIYLHPCEVAEAQQELPKDFNAFLRIGEDGTVTVFTGKVELGQGIITSLAQMAAEELDVPFSAVRLVMGDTDLCPFDRGTFGSMSTRFFGPPLREAAGEARAVLMELASEKLGVPADQLTVAGGFVSRRQDPGVRVSYAELARGKRIEKHLGRKPGLKSFAQFTVSGQPLRRADAVQKVTGQAKYAGDIRLPGMLYARILRPPAHGAKLKSVDTSAAEKMPGIRLVREGDLLAVLHEWPDMAERARAQIKAEYDLPGAEPNQETIYQHVVDHAPEGRVAGQGGDLSQGEQLARKKFDQVYHTPYVAHAPMEPHTAVAAFEGNKITIWLSTQSPFSAKSEVARALGIAPENVRVITPFVGGGFGGKNRNRQAVEAALLARAAGKPVHLAWSREEEFFFDTFQPASVVRIRSGLDADNRITFWDYHVHSAGNRGTEMFYDIPHYRTTTYGGWMGGPSLHPFEVGAWRAPGNNTNSFARESHIDFLAAQAGLDPLGFRLQNMKDARMRNVLEKAAQAFGWKPAKSPSGRGYGVACGLDAGAYVALMAEVRVDRKTGEISVTRLLCAQDMGQVINPEGARMQMEGCLMMGLGYALSEELHFRNGRILDLNFSDYAIPRFSWMPRLETILVENNSLSPQGGGEPAIINVGAVLANAVFDAISVRFNRLPMTPSRVVKEIAKPA
jgi:nicotinate dehydrogenase subunit B